jgi:hypothetical protein
VPHISVESPLHVALHGEGNEIEYCMVLPQLQYEVDESLKLDKQKGKLMNKL